MLVAFTGFFDDVAVVVRFGGFDDVDGFGLDVDGPRIGFLVAVVGLAVGCFVVPAVVVGDGRDGDAGRDVDGLVA